MKNPYEMPYDDTVCACGRKLPPDAEIQPGTWQDHGFCHAGCAVASTGGFRLFGAAAVEMAEREGTRGGPGFERSLIREWLKGATSSGPAMLTRFSCEVEQRDGRPDAWVWRLSSNGVCHVARWTRKR